MDNIKFRLDYNALISANFAASKDQHRYYLCGVNVQKIGNNITYMGTDGSILIKIETQDYTDSIRDFNIIIPSEVLTHLTSFIKNYGYKKQYMHGGSGYFDITIHHDKAIIDIHSNLTSNLVTQHKLIDGTYPDARKGIPTKSGDIGQITLDIKLLTRIQKSFHQYFNSRDAQLKLEFTGNNIDPVKMQHAEFIGVIMPCREYGYQAN